MLLSRLYEVYQHAKVAVWHLATTMGLKMLKRAEEPENFGRWNMVCILLHLNWIVNKKQGLDHWRYMQALQGLHPLKPGLQGVYSLIGPRLAVKLDTRVPPSSHQRVYSQMFEKMLQSASALLVHIIFGRTKIWGKWSASKNLVAKRPGAWERGTWMLTITNHEFNPAGYLNHS